MTETDTTRQQPAIRRLTAQLLVVVVAMFGFGYALVPLYDILCEITGLNGKTGQVSASELSAPDYSRQITVKFVATANNSIPIKFGPKDLTMQVYPGEIETTEYLATNNSPAALVAQATPSVVPREASLYFNKTECFCFTRQNFQPGESRSLPVRFVIDPDLPKHIDSVVLSYTLFNVSEQS